MLQKKNYKVFTYSFNTYFFKNKLFFFKKNNHNSLSLISYFNLSIRGGFKFSTIFKKVNYIGIAAYLCNAEKFKGLTNLSMFSTF